MRYKLGIKISPACHTKLRWCCFSHEWQIPFAAGAIQKDVKCPPPCPAVGRAFPMAKTSVVPPTAHCSSCQPVDPIGRGRSLWNGNGKFGASLCLYRYRYEEAFNNIYKFTYLFHWKRLNCFWVSLASSVALFVIAILFCTNAS
jgi:hypothetical protein